MVDTSKLWRRLKIREESGQSLVEFALVLIFIILPLIMVFIEGSVMLYKYVALTNAAREGARTGSIYLYVGTPPGNSSLKPDEKRCDDVLATIGGTVGPLIPPPSICRYDVYSCGSAGSNGTTCQIAYGASSAPIPDPLRSTDLMTVTVAHTHTFLFGALGSEATIQARSSMRIEPSTVISGTGP